MVGVQQKVSELLARGAQCLTRSMAPKAFFRPSNQAPIPLVLKQIALEENIGLTGSSLLEELNRTRALLVNPTTATFTVG